MKRGKKYLAAAEKIDGDNLYTPSQAVGLARETSITRIDTK